MDNTIKCRICDKEVGRQGLSLHLKTHNIKFQEYLVKYFDDFPDFQKCEMCGGICKRNKKFCSRTCTTEWRKTLVGENGLRFGKTLSLKSKKKMSNTLKELYIDKNNHGRTGKKLTKKSKNKISVSQKKYYETHDSPFLGKTHTPETIKKIFKHKPMNKLEKKVADWLDGKNIKYTFQFFLNIDGVCKSYDFKLKNSNKILEIHGDYWHGGIGVKKHHFGVDKTIQNDKLKKDIAETHGYEVITIWEHELKKDTLILDNIFF